jgi:glycosyltransferase involved in cell wall biosynthesis
MILSVLFYLFLVTTVIQIIYYLVFSCFLFDSKKTKKKHKDLPISVIVHAKNEAKNLKEFLPSILNQDYPDFEVVLINDASSDKTLEIMQYFSKLHNNIKIVNVKNVEVFWMNKKYALTLGIKAAKNEHFLFTDANCKPVSKHWIYEMSSNLNSTKSIILGYGKYKKENTLVNIFVRFETLLTAIQYFSYAKIGAPYMAVGRNLAYNKEIFFDVNGFTNHMHINAGADELFIQDAANNKNTIICASKNSFTVSIAPNSFTKWFQLKREHISTISYYKVRHQLFLKLFLKSKVLFYLLATLLFFFYPWQIIGSIILIYYIIQLMVIGLSAKKLNEPNVTYLVPFLEIGLLIFNFTIFITNLASKPNHWK